ncbi:MAG: cytochrome c [Acidobacteria bacterium]|nr:MAG: cytochrome c [Acidobacteriota bacterium]
MDSAGSDLHPGLEILLRQPLSFSPLSASDLDTLWTVWEPAERERAAAASAEERRRMTFERYGLVDRGAIDDSGLPLGYASDDQGRLYPNCLSCHGGSIAGLTIPGIGNNRQDLAGLVGDLAALRAERAGGDPEAARRGATLGFPLNFSRGTTNATMYSILLGSMRDENLDQVMPPRLSQEFVHNSIDAPPWWHFAKKSRIYWDGMAPKTGRTLMQFAMAPGLSGEAIRSWEDEFETIRSYIESLEPPPFPGDIDRDLAARGRQAFEAVCSRCHGTYDPEGSDVYPERVVSPEEVGTDTTRLEAIRPESKQRYNRSWFSHYGRHPVLVDTEGYVAPPLDGIWATAPYLHNGSVPTLWHLLHPDQRPVVWRRRTGHDGEAGVLGGDYDATRLGLLVAELEAVPPGTTGGEAREYYDTALASQSAEGHRFPLLLTEEQRRAVLEYLKTL